MDDRLAYSSNESGKYEVYVQSFPAGNGKWQVSTNGGIQPRWRRDGLQIFYSVRSERLLMEQLDYNLLFRWFVGMNLDEPVWVPTVFTKNRDRLLKHAIAESFFQRVLKVAHRDAAVHCC